MPVVSEPNKAAPPENLRWFLWFRLLFNCRFYYPVYAVMFTDFGLSMSNFAALNLLWAVVIVLLEVPSGALADVVGRRTLVVAAAWLMVTEMVVLLMCPVKGAWVFVFFAVNRILSGTAEASASGADEALAYDSYPEEERQKSWPRVMAKLTRWMAMGAICTSITGALVYDHEFVNKLWHGMGLTGDWRPDQTIKFPLFLNLLTAIGCVFVTLRLRETHPVQPSDETPSHFRHQIAVAWAGICQSAKWIWRTPAALALILLGFQLDSATRIFYTINSLYFRLIEIPEFYYGFIGAGFSLLALACSPLMEWMTHHLKPFWNFMIVEACLFSGLFLASLAVPRWGLLLPMPLWLAGRFLPFFHSAYINQVTPSERRATVLSFRGLSMNLVYGLLSLAYGWQYAVLKDNFPDAARTASHGPDPLLLMAMQWWPWCFLASFIALLLFSRWKTGASLHSNLSFKE